MRDDARDKKGRVGGTLGMRGKREVGERKGQRGRREPLNWGEEEEKKATVVCVLLSHKMTTVHKSLSFGVH